eukprot:TRINITY_DN1226_c0_g1_i2.p2 TRINITY_DN1226_c0_g1~~TRINITY_DN1226_c0_g1_i2.p2  ORF type:complete len:111 (+),score=7.19 TRINITY_DN1226_c0_g1_i2:64-396(+)
MIMTMLMFICLIFSFSARIGHRCPIFQKAKKGKKEQSEEGARHKEGKDCFWRKEVNVLKALLNALYFYLHFCLHFIQIFVKNVRVSIVSCSLVPVPVSYTHLTLPTILRV